MKAYAMTGWRCGWTIGPKEFIGQCNVFQGHSTSNVASITQKAAIAALTGPQESVGLMLDEYRKRRDAVHAWLTADSRFVSGRATHRHTTAGECHVQPATSPAPPLECQPSTIARQDRIPKDIDRGDAEKFGIE